MYDYIVIGAGSAGCVLAHRLSADPGNSVLLLEAGGADDNEAIHIPAAFPSLFKTPLDWGHEYTPQAHANGRSDYLPQGKMLGGSSSINAMIYMRGHPAVYDQWAALGNTGWSYADVLPYFKKSQNQERGASAHHGVGGPINVADLRDPNPLARALLKAAEELGLPRNDDFNAGDQIGFGLFQVTQRNGKRCSAAVGYIHPIAGRPNLTVVTGAHATRLIIDNRRCAGVAYVRGGKDETARASREVIVSSGAVHSPQLLMLSGIGCAAHLREHGIAVVHDLPGVGQNLMEHVMVPVSYHCTQPITLAAAQTPEQLAKFQTQQKGLLTSNVGEAGGFLKLDPHAPFPDLQFHFGPTWFIFHGFENPPGHGFTILPSTVATKSRGILKLRTANPLDAPLINPNYFAVEDDLNTLVTGVKIARRLLNTAAFDDYRGEEHTPGRAIRTDAEIAEFCRNTVQNIYHPVGTCRMGTDAMAVVDGRLRVRGIQALRVADASIMPFIPNANTNAPTIMIGEKAADMILQDHA
jgi:choline dehydrogenase-like flavoprotein